MRPATQISVSEYLATSYDPDCGYVEGEVVERNLGGYDYSKPQGRLVVFLGARKGKWGIRSRPGAASAGWPNPLSTSFRSAPISLRRDSFEGRFVEPHLREDRGISAHWVIDPRKAPVLPFHSGRNARGQGRRSEDFESRSGGSAGGAVRLRRALSKVPSAHSKVGRPCVRVGDVARRLPATRPARPVSIETPAYHAPGTARATHRK
jgi:hypothetical protein